MTAIKKLIDGNGNQYFPQTHTKAVIDDNGYTAESRLGAMQDEINNLQEGVVVVGEGMTPVPSDLAPTENSSNWVTSGGVYNAIRGVKNLLYTGTDITSSGSTGKYINNTQGVGNECPMTYTTAAWMECWKISAKAGEYYTISGKDDSGLVWATVNSSGIITDCSATNLGTFSNLAVNIDEDCTLIINLHNEYSPNVIKNVLVLNDIQDVHGKYVDGKKIGDRTGYRLDTSGSLTSDSWHSTYTFSNNNYIAIECATKAYLATETKMAAINFYSGTPSSSTLINSIRCDSNTLKTFYSIVPEGTVTICVDIRRASNRGNDFDGSYIKVYTENGVDNAYGVSYQNNSLPSSTNVGDSLDFLVFDKLSKTAYGTDVASSASWSVGFISATSNTTVVENNTNTTWRKTDYIDVHSYKSMTIELPYVDSGSTTNCVAFYSEDKTVLFIKNLTEGIKGETFLQTFNINSVYYVRLTAYVDVDMSAFVFNDPAPSGYKQVTIAASNGFGRIGRVDYTCKGINDELTIQQAISDVFAFGGGEVILLPGDYYITSFPHYNSTDNLYSAIEIPNNAYSVYRPSVHIRGAGGKYDCTLHVSGSGLDSNMTYSVIACAYPRSNVTLQLSSFRIASDTNQHKIIGIDLINCQLADIKGVVIYSTKTTYPVEGLIGIRGFRVAQNGSLQNISNVICSRLHTAFDMSGEHIVMSMCGALRCVYGFKFSRRSHADGTGTSDHPITLINCHDERNQNLPYFGTIGNRGQTVTFIDFNTEAEHLDTPWGCYRNYAKEAVPGRWRGVVYYSHASRAGVNVVNIPFWEHGHGQGFRTVNVAQMQRGTTAERNSYTPDYCQRFFDTTLNKELICVSTKGRAIGSFTVTSESVSSGSITFNVGDMTKTITIRENTGAENIAKDIYTQFIPTTVPCEIEGSSLYIKSNSFMVITDNDVSYTDNGTGIALACEVKDYGSVAQWVDTMGNIV